MLPIPIPWAIDKATGWQQRRRKVRVLAHEAVFLTSPPSEPHYFVKVTNLSPQREVEVTHIWFDTDPVVHILNPQRPLPARLRLDETYETWILKRSVPDDPDVFGKVRVQLSNGHRVRSRHNSTVPPMGYVAGGGSS